MEELLVSSKQRARALPDSNETTADYGKSTPGAIPELSESDREKVLARTALSAVVVHESVREEGVRELNRSSLALAWSGLAAGLSMGFSLVAKGLFHAYLPNAPWRPLLENFGYSVGFLLVLLGRQQLFTENTLTVILPLLAQPSMRTFLHVLRLWGVVFATNMLGTFLFATIIAHVAVFPPAIQLSFLLLSQQSVSRAFDLTLVRTIFAGW